MKSSLFVFAFVMLAGIVVAAEANLYINPKFAPNQTLTKRKNKLFINDHWYEGEVSYDGSYKGAPVLKVKSVKVSWGGFSGVVATSPEAKYNFKPGKYLLTVWCKPEGKPTSIYLYHSLRDKENKSIRRNTKSYRGNDLPPAGEWTELVLEFEVKPGDARNSLGYAIHSTDSVGSQTVWFADPKITAVEEE